MRLSTKEIETIKKEIAALDPDAEVYLYGSRTDDNKKGGDIDLLIISAVIGWKEISKIKWQIYSKFGEQKIDIIYCHSGTNYSIS